MNNPWANLDWNSIRVFLAVADNSSLSAASPATGYSINTVRKVIERLENQCGYLLFHRDKNSLKLTPEGRRLVASAREVQDSIFNMCRVASTCNNSVKGPIRLAITESLGPFWLMPQLSSYINSVAGINCIELQCASKSVDISRLEADMTIRLAKPGGPNLVQKKLGTLHSMPWASSDYLDRFGVPKQISDLAGHRIIQQTADHSELTSKMNSENICVLKTDFLSAHYWAVSKGNGIGMLPTYSQLISDTIIPLDVKELRMSDDIWLTCHTDMLQSPRHKKFIDWLIEAFDPITFPWFQKDFIHPNNFTQMTDWNSLKHYFHGFALTAESSVNSVINLVTTSVI